MVTEEQITVALEAFRKGPPGVVRLIRLVDSYPGEYQGDPDAYKEIPCYVADERRAMRDVLEAALVYGDSTARS